MGYQTKMCITTLEGISSKDDASEDAGTQTRQVLCTLQDGITMCGNHGTCESELKICDCDCGYAGERCDEPPGLNFTGIVPQLMIIQLH